VLTLLDERPMHGYELITELDARSGGRWRPSPGAIYPALNRLEDAGLLVSTDEEGKRRFALTDRGRQALTQLRDEHHGEPAPWDDPGTGRRGDLRRHLAELGGQARQIGRFGDADQIEQARAVLADATRRLYDILAGRGDQLATDAADGAVPPDGAGTTAGDAAADTPPDGHDTAGDGPDDDRG
jgi:DNA-binding PadR family transcriptional regulator